LDCFCTGSNWCYIATHSAGDLMMGYALANYGSSARMVKNAAPNSSGVRSAMALLTIAIRPASEVRW
ncbi:MAG TPA: hypothetical protein VFS02_04375, partial [Telluria sp.]|nr:hypothetical protein [Telluria sp.]